MEIKYSDSELIHYFSFSDDDNIKRLVDLAEIGYHASVAIEKSEYCNNWDYDQSFPHVFDRLVNNYENEIRYLQDQIDELKNKICDIRERKVESFKQAYEDKLTHARNANSLLRRDITNLETTCRDLKSKLALWTTLHQGLPND